MNHFNRGKSSPKIGATQKLPKLNSRPMGQNSLNLVSLALLAHQRMNLIRPNKYTDTPGDVGLRISVVQWHRIRLRNRPKFESHQGCQVLTGNAAV
jgi:hypothetical protein